MKKHLLALGLLTAVAVPASAEGVFIFGDLGQSKASLDIGSWNASKSDTAYSFGVGYAINKTFSLEAAYRDLGSFTVYEDEDGKDVLDASSVQASLVAAYPISPVVNIYGRLGLAKLTVDESTQYFDYEEYNESNSQSKNKTFYGIGASYAINSQFSLRAEYDRYSKWDGLTVSALTIGAVYSF